jgi:hypothetical protein
MMDERSEIAVRILAAAVACSSDITSANGNYPKYAVRLTDELLAELERTKPQPPELNVQAEVAPVAVDTPEPTSDPECPYTEGDRLRIADKWAGYFPDWANQELRFDRFQREANQDVFLRTDLWIITKRVHDGATHYFYPNMVELDEAPPPSSAAVDQLGASVMGDLGPALEDEEGQALCDVCTTERSTLLTKDGRMLCQPCFTKQVGASSAEGPREIEEAEAMRALHVIGSTAYPKPPTFSLFCKCGKLYTSHHAIYLRARADVEKAIEACRAEHEDTQPFSATPKP